MNVLVLAYIGDSIYELKVRDHFISLGNVNEIQKVVIKYVSAKGQAKFVTYLLENDILNEEEISIFKRAKNHKSNHKPKNTSIITSYLCILISHLQIPCLALILICSSYYFYNSFSL